MRAFHAALLTLATLLCTTSQAALTYRVERVPVPPDSGDYYDFSVSGINNSGYIAGTLTSNPYSDAYIYRSGGSLDIYQFSAGYSSGLVSLNDRNQVAADYELGRHEYTHPYIFDLQPYKATDISLEDDPNKGGSILALNNIGHAIGYFGGKYFFYDGTQSRHLDLPTNSVGLAPMGLNDHDVIAGLAYWNDKTKQVFLSSDGQVNYLAGVDDYYDLNNAGQVLGARGDDLVMVEGDRITRLANRREFLAQDMNDRGWITGNTSGPMTASQALLYRGGKTWNLNDLLSPEDAAHWTLTSGVGLNNKGQITGYGLLDGQRSIFIATPVPEPATTGLMLAGLGLVGLVARRRRPQA